MLELIMYIGGMNTLKPEKQKQIVAALVEGNSLRSTARMCNVSFNAVLQLLPRIGKACGEYQNQIFRNLKSKGFSVMKYGASFMRKRRMFRRENVDSLGLEISGLGWLLMRRQS